MGPPDILYQGTELYEKWNNEATILVKKDESLGSFQWCLIRTPHNYPLSINKAGYTATPVACGWAGAIFEVTGAFGQER